MRLLEAILRNLQLFLRVLAYGWFRALLVLLRWLCALIRYWYERSKIPERRRRVAQERCVKIKESAYKRPDPMIYSQFYLMNLGLRRDLGQP